MGSPSAAAQEKRPALVLKTGPEIGQPIPPFKLPDQNGRQLTFETVRGPKGALIVFHRSADW
jgi:peroxiredoxin